jgi:hypothetical protein
VPSVPTDNSLLTAPTDEYGIDELRRSTRYRTALWFDRMGWVSLPLWFVVLFAYESIAAATPVLAFGLVGAAIVLRRRAGVPPIRPSKRNALALYRWRQYRRDVYWLSRP